MLMGWLVFVLIGCLSGDSQADMEAFESDGDGFENVVVETHTVEENPEETLLEEEYVYSCEGGIARWNSCFDMRLPEDLECTDEIFAELALIESLSVVSYTLHSSSCLCVKQLN